MLEDEVDIAGTRGSGAPVVRHTIVLANGGGWTIEAENILYQWAPNDAPATPS